MTETTVKGFEKVATMNAWELALILECASPDGEETAGAKWLTAVRDHVTEQYEWAVQEDELTDAEGLADTACKNYVGEVYTATIWAVFAELCLWRVEEAEEVNGEGYNDMTDRAMALLGLCADRIIRTLCHELLEGDE